MTGAKTPLPATPHQIRNFGENQQFFEEFSFVSEAVADLRKIPGFRQSAPETSRFFQPPRGVFIHLEVFLRQIDEDFVNYYTEWIMLRRLPGQGPAAPPAEGRPSATVARMQASLRVQAGLRNASSVGPVAERCSKCKAV